MNIRPELSAWPLPPIDIATLATSGSAWITAPTAFCRSSMAANEMSCPPSVMPTIRPVSCCGKKPFGMITNR